MSLSLSLSLFASFVTQLNSLFFLSFFLSLFRVFNFIWIYYSLQSFSHLITFFFLYIFLFLAWHPLLYQPNSNLSPFPFISFAFFLSLFLFIYKLLWYFSSFPIQPLYILLFSLYLLISTLFFFYCIFLFLILIMYPLSQPVSIAQNLNLFHIFFLR